jgi:hypothetical protein
MPFAIAGRVLVTLAALGLTAGCTGGGTPASAPHAARHHQATTASRFRVVSYHGVHVTVPASWPVVDGMHTVFCGGPFPSRPTVFTGPQLGPAPSCPAPIRPAARRDGVWLQPGTAPSDARPVRTKTGSVLLEERPVPGRPLMLLWYHRVFILVGIGPDPAVARSIVNSIGARPGTPDTRAAGVCPRSAGPQGMPQPERLTRRLVVDQGDITLAPPRRSDRPVMTAAQAWAQSAQSSPKSPFERYRLILARYSSKFPARPNSNGSYTPMNTDVLAWAVYAMPYGAAIPGCGWWGLDTFDASTGEEIGSDGWWPGP